MSAQTQFKTGPVPARGTIADTAFFPRWTNQHIQAEKRTHEGFHLLSQGRAGDSQCRCTGERAWAARYVSDGEESDGRVDHGNRVPHGPNRGCLRTRPGIDRAVFRLDQAWLPLPWKARESKCAGGRVAASNSRSWWVARRRCCRT